MERYNLKLVLLGEARVGKTSLLMRYCDRKFDKEVESTFEGHYKEKKINIGNASIKLTIWDTAGQERFHALAPIYYRNAHGAILVYDVTDKNSFNNIKNWINELYKMVDDIVIIIASNKSDLKMKKKVDFDEAKKYANSMNAMIMETSAKNGKGVDQLFYLLTKSIIQKLRNKKKTQNLSRRSSKKSITFEYDNIDDNNINNNNNENNNNSCFCNII